MRALSFSHVQLFATSWTLPGSSVHGILQARTQEWVAIPLSRGSSWPRDWIRVSCIAGRFFTIWATREAQSTLYPQANITWETDSKLSYPRLWAIWAQVWKHKESRVSFPTSAPSNQGRIRDDHLVDLLTGYISSACYFTAVNWKTILCHLQSRGKENRTQGEEEKEKREPNSVSTKSAHKAVRGKLGSFMGV